MCLKLSSLKFQHRKYKWTMISFSTQIFTKTKCQVSLVVQYTCSKYRNLTVQTLVYHSFVECLHNLSQFFHGQTNSFSNLLVCDKSLHLTETYMKRDMTKPTKSVCAQRRLRSVWASASDEELRMSRITSKPTKWPVRPESSLSAWRKLGSLATHWVHSEDSDQTGRMPRLICVFAGRTLILLVLSCRGSYFFCRKSWKLLFG